MCSQVSTTPADGNGTGPDGSDGSEDDKVFTERALSKQPAQKPAQPSNDDDDDEEEEEDDDDDDDDDEDLLDAELDAGEPESESDASDDESDEEWGE